MDEQQIGLVSLVWVVYTYVLTNFEKQTETCLSRLKFALSIFNGVIDLDQLSARQAQGVNEVLNSAKIFRDNEPGKNTIEKFRNVFSELFEGKDFLIVNLFLLTGNAILILFGIQSIFNFWETLFVVHIIVSLVFSIVFYYFSIKLEKLEFTDFIVK